MRPSASLLTVLVALSAIGGCGRSWRPPHEQQRGVKEAVPKQRNGSLGPVPAPATASVEARTDNPVVARLDGKEIRAAELAGEIQRHFPDVASAALTRIIGSNVAEREGKKIGISVPPEFLREARKKIRDDLRQQAAVTYGIGTSAEAFVRMQFRRELAEHVEILLEEKRYRYLVSRVIRYHTLRVDRAELDVIVVRDRKLAEELASKLDQGADFGRLAEEHSIHSSAKKRGRLSPLPREALHPAAASRAFIIQIGERTGVLDVDDGVGNRQYEILRLVKLWPGRNLTWSEASKEIESGLDKRSIDPAEWAAWFLRLEKLYNVRLSGNL